MKLDDLIAYADRQLSPEEEKRVEQALYEDARARDTLAAILRQRLMLAEAMNAQEDAITTRRGSSRASPSSAIRRSPSQPVNPEVLERPSLPRWVPAAAVFLISIVGGVLWWGLWLTPSPERRVERGPEGFPTDYQPSLPTLDRPPPKPLPPEPGSEKDPLDYENGALTHRPIDPQRLEKERIQREEEELKRLSKEHLRILAMDLPRAKPRRTSTVAPFEEEEENGGTTEPVAPEALAGETEPKPIGRVLFVEANAKDTVVMRADHGAEKRTPLTSGTILMTGDRVETQRLNDGACAAVRLNDGATVDLAGETTIKICNIGHIRLESGRIYACVQRGGFETEEYRPSFLLETSAGRYLTEGAQMEVSASNNVSIQPETSAKIASGRVYLLNEKGRALGLRGQELRAIGRQAPVRSQTLSGPIWRGRDLAFENLPCGHDNPIVVLNDTPRNCLLEEYGLSLAHSGTRRVVAIGAGYGGNLVGNYKELSRYLQVLKKRGLRNPPEVLLGSTQALQVPASGRAEDTRAEASNAVRRLVDLARRTTPSLPVLVVCSGSMNEVASAWLLDRRCATNLIPVLGYDGNDYKSASRDPWAAQIVLTHFRCVILDKTYRPPIDMQLYDQIPSPLWQNLTREMGCADTALLATVAMPGLAWEVQRSVCVPDGVGQFRFEPKADGLIWLVKKIDLDALKQEMEQTFFGR